MRAHTQARRKRPMQPERRKETITTSKRSDPRVDRILDRFLEWERGERVFVDKRARIQFRMKKRTCVMWQAWFNDRYPTRYQRWMDER
jgi:hypothetical protein